VFLKILLESNETLILIVISILIIVFMIFFYFKSKCTPNSEEKIDINKLYDYFVKKIYDYFR